MIKLTPYLIVFSMFSSLFAVGVNATPFDIEEVMECQKTFKDRLDYARCLDAKLGSLEREMKTWENNLIFKLKELGGESGKPEAIALFNKSVKHFEKYRDSSCQWQYIALLPDVNAASAIVKECKLYMVKTRIKKLKDVNAYEF